LAKTVTKNLGEIDRIITQSAPEFSLDRINHVDLAILRLAIYELAIAGSEPPKAVIDEAIELAKEYGGEASPGFINGVLGKVLSSPAQIKKTIANHLGADKITENADLRKDLNADEIEIADLLENFKIEKGTVINTVADILAYVEDHKD